MKSMISLVCIKKVLLLIGLVALLAGCGKGNSITVKKDVNELKDAEIIAFPGAEGAGKFTKGGRGGDVYHVTTLQDSGPGSFREGIESIEGPRTIVFDLSGTIRLKKDIKIKNVSYLTIAGQTAPGKGITFADRNLRIENCSHVIARYFRIRLGDENKPDGTSPDCITIEYSNHVMLDHLSLSWGIDGNGDFRGLKHSTLQWLIFSEALHDSIHEKGSHAMCSSFRESEGFATLHHNIYASSRNRHPSTAGGSEVMEFANNLNYNWSGCHNLSGEQYNLLNNYYKAGLTNGNRLPIRYKSKALKPVSHGYFSGNHFDGLPEEYNQDNYTAIDFESSEPDGKYKGTTRDFFEATERFDAGKYKLTRIETAQETYESCLKQSGCSLVRDAVDQRLIESIRNNTGKVIDSQDEVGGWERYPSVARPPDFDTDGDGMPDEWERTSGLNPDDPADGNQDRDDDGFTNFEDYLNSLTQR
jgi:pectate lyase